MNKEDLQRYEKGKTCTVSEAADILGSTRYVVISLINRGLLIAWPANEGVDKGKRLLYREQVKEMRGRVRAEAIQVAQNLQLQFDWDIDVNP